MKFFKEKQGITLIALIVTIIVLLILAGVTLSLVAGSNGIIGKAAKAVEATNETTILEEVGLVISEATMQYYLDGANETLAEYLAKNYSSYETASGAIIDFDENGEITYTKGKETTILVMDQNGNIEITEKITEGGAILDKSAPTIKIDATTTNSITFTAIDRVGVVAYAVTETAEVPTDWTEITTTTKFTKTVSGKMQNTTYYIWAKDAAENVTFITAKTINFESFAYTTAWNETMATITVSTPNAGVQYKTASEDWTDYREPISVASGTTVYFQVTDGINTVKLSSVTPLVERTVTYDANGGTGNLPNTQTVEHTKMVNVDFTTIPKKENYVFLGWATKAQATSEEYSEYGTKSFKMGTENMVLYAVWCESIKAYSQNGLMIHYDGINNIENGHNNTTTSWKDLSKNGNEGILSGCVWGDNYLKFDGMDDYVNCGVQNYSQYTMQAVVSYDDLDELCMHICSNMESGGSALIKSSSKTHMFQGWFGSYLNVYAGSGIIPNKLYYLTGEYDGEKQILYENGVKYEMNYSGDYKQPDAGNVFALGCNPSPDMKYNQEFLNGKIYSIRLYNRALTDNEVKRNYEADKVRFEK